MSLTQARVVIAAQIKRIDTQIEVLSQAKKNLRQSLKMLGRFGSEDVMQSETKAIKAAADAVVISKNKGKSGRKAQAKPAQAAAPAKRARKTGVKAGGKVVAKVTMQKNPGVAARTASVAIQKSGELPKTGAQFMISLVNAVPKSRGELLTAAFAKLGINPNSVQSKKLERRIATAFDVLVKTGKVADKGAGRERKFLAATTQ